MTNIELYINEVLTDTGDGFSVRLNRQLINPAELNTKDAQFSFSITIPTTANNNKALDFANVEEVKGKFNKEYRAQLVVNSVRIFVGLFRLSEVSAKGYKGNLYIPAVKSIKDIFGDVNLNQIAPYRIPFTDFASSITAINNAALSSPQMAIFPYVLYGLLPKVPIDKNANNYSARDVWDASVRYNMQDVPPSINPLLMLKHLFNSNGYELGGSAFNDPKLTQLYQSYKNSTDYVQPWNYGHHARIELSGTWSSTRNKRAGDAFQFERGVNQSSDRGYNIYSADLFDAVNSSVDVNNDPGGNVIQKLVNDNDAVTWSQTQVRIPTSGFYKVRFIAGVTVYSNSNWRSTDPKTGVQHVSGDGDKHVNHFGRRVYEVKLLRDRKSGDFGLSGAKLDGGFYETNQPQNGVFDEVNIPKHFPQVPSTGQLNLIDPLQNRKFVLGFGFGSRDGYNNALLPQFRGNIDNHFYNPQDTALSLAQMQAAKPGLSWDASETEPNRIGIKNVGYWKHGRIGTFDNEGDNPDANIDYSGGVKITGKVLDANGNPTTPDAGNLATRFNGYALNRLTGFQTPLNGWTTSDFIDVRSFTGLNFSAAVDASDDVAVLAFYDVNKFFIGAGIVAPATGTDNYTSTAITYPPEAVYVKLSANTGTLTIGGSINAANNIILERFGLQRFFSYVINGGPSYTGYAYIHDGASVTPKQIVPFVDGVASFDTSIGYTDTPRVTLFLKTAEYDVDGTLEIDKIIDGTSEEVVGWELTNKYAINIANSPDNYVYRLNDWQGNGEINAIVWLEAGELLTVASVSEEGLYRRNGMHTTRGWTNHEIFYSLRVEPFRIDDAWLKVDYQGHGTAVMNWNDPTNFDVDSINLAGFLPADMKANDYIDQFVKAFNLKLTQTGANAFSLDVKQSKAAVTTRSINLDGIASIRDRSNTPLGLPSVYKLGFTINTDEEGYFMTGDDGGGEYKTGSIEDTVIEQKSSFSYNWFKPIKRDGLTLNLPVISKHEVWTGATPYSEAMAKRFTDLPLRFWYLGGILEGSYNINGTSVSFAKVTNENAESVLNYKQAPKTILSNYFTILGVGSESHYTEAEAFLTPYQYASLDGSLMVTFNGDLYYAAQLDGYDPTAKNKTKLKLIRKI